MDVQLQNTLGDAYTLERELGGGGMSRVFLAEETALKRKVVVKILPPDLFVGVNVERFNREILLAAKLQHPHIVPVLTAGETSGIPYYTMPFVEGESLRVRLARGPLPVSDAVSLLRDVAKALAYAHDRGIVHRDIKPDNVLVTGGSATVTDFGIAKAISVSRTLEGPGRLTQVGTSIGTPGYMAPEQAAADPRIDQRADIYAFGCMAYEMLAGRPPFADRTPQGLLAAHMGEAPAPISTLRSDTPSELADLISRCLEKEADRRPQSATELVRALETMMGAGSGATTPLLLGGPSMFWKALAIYAVAFLAVAILAKAAIVGIGLPDWVFPGSLIVMALGLPVVLWTGYVQRVTRRVMTTSPTATPGGTLSVTHGGIETIALKAAPHVSWFRTARGGMYALAAFMVVIAAFMGMRAFGIGPAGSLLGAGKVTSREPLLIADFKVSNGDSALGDAASTAVGAALSQSSVISLVSLSTVAGELRRMQRPLTTRLDLNLSRELAQRQGIKAVVDGSVTGVPGGYILTLRLVSADSGVELASFQEPGDGPRGFIDAADKLARELRGKIGESLRRVQATPRLAQATTGSLEALRKYSAAQRANEVEGQPVKAVSLAREAVAIDSTFAAAWRLMAISMSNAHLPVAPQDSALERAFHYRDRLTEPEKLSTVAAYFMNGPHRDRAKAVAAYETMLQKGYGMGNNLSLLLHYRGDYARAESLNLRDIARDSNFSNAYGNAANRELDQGKVKKADSTLALMRRRFPPNVNSEAFLSLLYAKGPIEGAERFADSLRAGREPVQRADAARWKACLALLRGRYDESRRLTREAQDRYRDQAIARVVLTDSVDALYTDAWFHGPSQRVVRTLDATLAALPLNAVPAVDRPYFQTATVYALSRRPDKARAILDQRQREIRDTALLRVQQPGLHTALAEIALAEHKPLLAVAEFHQGDVNASDGSHATDCGIVCLSFNLGRAFDAADMPDSAIAMYERYITTPFSYRWERIDHLALAGAHKRLGELYEAKGERQKAASHYMQFIELWKNADLEFQPRAAEVRRRLAKLGDTEKR